MQALLQAICGRRPRMEDAFSAIPFLLELPVPPGSGSEIYPARLTSESQKGSTEIGEGDCSSHGPQAVAGTPAASTTPPGGPPGSPAMMHPSPPLPGLPAAMQVGVLITSWPAASCAHTRPPAQPVR